MVFQREEPGQWKAGALAVLMHLLFLGVLIFGVSWQNREPAAIEVELWNALPGVPEKHAPPTPKPTPPKPVTPPKPTPPKPVPPPKPEPHPQAQSTKADIDLKAEAKRKQEEKNHKEAELKQKEEQQKLEQAHKEEEKHKQDQEKKNKQEKAEKLRKQQEQAEADAARKAQADAMAAQQAARAQAVDGYVGKISAKIRQRIIDQPCQPLGDPQVRFFITLMPTGELLFDPKLVKGSGSSACDEAIERAIKLASPFPKPDPSLGIRDLNLIFWPNRKD
jgi:colicin import membrane protein